MPKALKFSNLFKPIKSVISLVRCYSQKKRVLQSGLLLSALKMRVIILATTALIPFSFSICSNGLLRRASSLAVDIFTMVTINRRARGCLSLWLTSAFFILLLVIRSTWKITSFARIAPLPFSFPVTRTGLTLRSSRLANHYLRIMDGKGTLTLTFFALQALHLLQHRVFLSRMPLVRIDSSAILSA